MTLMTKINQGHQEPYSDWHLVIILTAKYGPLTPALNLHAVNLVIKLVNGQIWHILRYHDLFASVIFSSVQSYAAVTANLLWRCRC